LHLELMTCSKYSAISSKFQYQVLMHPLQQDPTSQS
jgi:hypothetical protein